MGGVLFLLSFNTSIFFLIKHFVLISSFFVFYFCVRFFWSENQFSSVAGKPMPDLKSFSKESMLILKAGQT